MNLEPDAIRHESPATARLDESGTATEIRSDDLLQGRRMVVINHHGQRYRLVQTRNDKLILQK